jgi:uncharacterized protein (DUF305 family)
VDDGADTGARPPTPRWARIVIAAGIAVALLLAGAAIGLLLAAGRAPATPAADSVDVGFAQDMSVHHEQAVGMATWERDHTTDPVLRQLAFDIETGQLAQIGRMQGWLALWQAPSQPTDGHMAWMGAAGHGGHGAGVAQMPGMATDEELADLRAATGEEFDVLFLQLMTRHHQGGVEMAEYAQTNADEWAVRRLASSILESQTGETQLMLSMLDERGAEPLPAP